jgi:hypothetical protein
MNHIDFVLWVVGWSYLYNLNPPSTSDGKVMGLLIWIIIAILLWFAK